MIGYETFYQAQLSSGIDDTDLVIPLDNVPTPSEGFLVLEGTVEAKREVIYYTSKDGSSVTCPAGAGNGRGYDGTTAVSHLQNAAVVMAPVGAMFAALADGTAIEDDAIVTRHIADDNVTSAKLAQTFFKGRYQSSTTNSDQSGITVQFGWGFIAGNGTGVATKAITFPTAYTTPLAVIISSAGYKSGSDPTDITQLDDGEGGEIVHRQTFDVITTGFTAKLIAEQGRNLGASTIRYGFTWISFGIV